MRPTIQAVVGVVLALPLLSQTQPSVAEILRKVANNYSHASEWDLAGTVTSISLQPATTVITSLRIAGKGSAKRRVEKQVNGLPEGSSIIIADGENIWAYYPKTNQFTKRPLPKDPEGALRYFNFALLLYQAGTNTGKPAQLLRQEQLEIGNTRVDCLVVRVAQYTWWIDRNRFVVLRDDQEARDSRIGGSSTLWTTVKLNEPIPDDLFTFTPPPGAQLVGKIDP
jgi:outer membrane lipoprotein-sorting protein